MRGQLRAVNLVYTEGGSPRLSVLWWQITATLQVTAPEPDVPADVRRAQTLSSFCGERESVQWAKCAFDRVQPEKNHSVVTIRIRGSSESLLDSHCQ